MYGEFNKYEYNNAVVQRIPDREIQELAKELGEYCESWRQYQEGDCSYTDYLVVKKNFKERWLRKGAATKRLTATCNKMIDEFKEEILEMINPSTTRKDPENML